MKKARVIYNPTSGKELLKKNLADILQANPGVVNKLLKDELAKR